MAEAGGDEREQERGAEAGEHKAGEGLSLSVSVLNLLYILSKNKQDKRLSQLSTQKRELMAQKEIEQLKTEIAQLRSTGAKPAAVEEAEAAGNAGKGI